MLTQQRKTELDEVFSLVYEELKRIASSVRKGNPNAPLNTTALVHEAWLKLQRSVGVKYESPAHLKAIVARAMRQILLDTLRRSAAMKRGGAGEAVLVPLDEVDPPQAPMEVDVLALEIALRKLTKMSPRQAGVVECRFYGRMTVHETAEALSVSPASVERDWRATRAWLAVELPGRRSGGKT